MVEKFKKKLNSNSGESISETLVALLIAALAMVMLAGAIGAATSIILGSRKKMKDYYDSNIGIVAMNGSTTASGSITITDDATEGKITIPSISVTFYKNETFTNKTVVSYKE